MNLVCLFHLGYALQVCDDVWGEKAHPVNDYVTHHVSSPDHCKVGDSLFQISFTSSVAKHMYVTSMPFTFLYRDSLAGWMFIPTRDTRYVFYPIFLSFILPSILHMIADIQSARSQAVICHELVLVCLHFKLLLAKSL